MNSVYNPQADVDTILAAANGADPATRFAIMTTLERYQTQLTLMRQLRADLAERGALVPPAGGKSRKKTVPNPSIAEYDKVAAAANQTVQALVRLCTGLMAAQTAGADEEDDL